MKAMLKIEEEHLKLQQERAASEAAMMQAVTAFFSNMTQMFGGHMPSFSSKPEVQNNNSAASQGGAGGSGTTAGSSGLHTGGVGAQQGGNNNNQASGSKTPSNPSSSCSNSPAYSHSYSNPPMVGNSGMNKMHGMVDGPNAATNMGSASAGHHYPYGGMNQPSPSPSSAGQMASPASYPLSPAYQQGVVNTMMGAGNSGTGGGGGGWYNNGSSGKGAASSNAPMAVHPFSSDILGIPKSRHDTM